MTLIEGDLPPDLARALVGAGRVAVDTETSGLDWVADTLHLCQLFSPETGPVLLRRIDSAPLPELCRVMADPGVVKVFHHAPFDLKFLDAQWGVRAMSVACTKTASKFLDPDLSASEHSLRPLLERHLGITIEKGAVRTSDWGTDVLTQEQVEYATADVAHLLPLLDVLTRRLDANGLSTLFWQVCEYMPVEARVAVMGVPNPLTY